MVIDTLFITAHNHLYVKMSSILKRQTLGIKAVVSEPNGRILAMRCSQLTVGLHFLIIKE